MVFIPSSEIKCPKFRSFTNWVGWVGQSNFAG